LPEGFIAVWLLVRCKDARGSYVRSPRRLNFVRRCELLAAWSFNFLRCLQKCVPRHIHRAESAR